MAPPQPPQQAKRGSRPGLGIDRRLPGGRRDQSESGSPVPERGMSSS